MRCVIAKIPGARYGRGGYLMRRGQPMNTEERELRAAVEHVLHYGPSAAIA